MGTCWQQLVAALNAGAAARGEAVRPLKCSANNGAMNSFSPRCCLYNEVIEGCAPHCRHNNPNPTDMRAIIWDDGTVYGNLNAYWGDPSYV